MEEKVEVFEGLNLVYYAGVSEFKSIRRSIKRGNVSSSGLIAPSRPFNNRGNTSKRLKVHSRFHNEYKKTIYNNMLTSVKRRINKE